VVILIVTAAFAISRFMLWNDYTDTLEKKLIKANLALLSATEACLLVSIVFMIDTYRRLKKSFARNIKFRENKEVMVLQIYVISIHLCLEIALGTTIEIAVDTNKLDNKSELISSLKIVLVTVLFIGQAVLIYLLDNFSKPIKLNKTLKSSFESNESTSTSDQYYEEKTSDATRSSAIG
jgi:hypothetical protein